MPKKQQLQQLQMELAALKNNPKQIVNDIDQHSQLDVAQQFYASLPAKSEMNSKITVVLRAATDNDLVVNKVEYIQPVVTSALTLPIVQYQINFPVQGNYKQIRQFINQVLTRLPSIALNDISLRREDVAVEMVDARIRFTLY
ncbi:MAG: type 4a pilus biogenesis protein PilO, partial [Methylotenera sp.]